MARFCVMLASFCLIITICFTTEAAKLPKSFKLCHQSDPNFNECLRPNIEDAIRDLKDGAVELGLNSLEPLHIDELHIGEGKGPVNVQQNFKNMELHGLTSSKVLKVKMSLDENLLFAQSITPELRLSGEYNMNGRVLLLPIYGDGLCNVTLVNTKINHTVQGVRFEKKGHTYMKIVNYTITLRPELVKFQFANLFNGDQKLGDQINKVINDAWDDVFTDVRGGYEIGIAAIFKDLANRVFPRVPLFNIFLE